MLSYSLSSMSKSLSYLVQHVTKEGGMTILETHRILILQTNIRDKNYRKFAKKLSSEWMGQNIRIITVYYI